MVPPQLAGDVELLQHDGREILIVEEGSRCYVIVKGFRLPDGKYQPAETDLMMMADYQYPASRMDMYWTEPEVHLKTGGLPQNADQFEVHGGRRWQRWSWHYPTWDPGKHNVLTHLEAFRDRLARGT